MGEGLKRGIGDGGRARPIVKPRDHSSTRKVVIPRRRGQLDPNFHRAPDQSAASRRSSCRHTCARTKESAMRLVVALACLTLMLSAGHVAADKPKEVKPDKQLSGRIPAGKEGLVPVRGYVADQKEL